MNPSAVTRRRKAWITGSNGFLASYLFREAARAAPEWEVVGVSRPDLDLLDCASVTRAFTGARPELILHCAAMSRSGECQSDPARARRINVEATGHLAALAAEIPLIFFSSDLVFDGARGNYVEKDAVNPLSVYGETKAEAELLVLRNPQHTVVRTSLNAGRSPNGEQSFTEEIRNAWRAGRTLRFFHDEYRCPIAALVTARAVWELVRLSRPGLYHLAGAARLSRVAIGQLLAHRWSDVAARFEPASLRDYPGPPRAPDTSLNCERLQSLLSFRLPGFGEWLAKNPDEPI